MLFPITLALFVATYFWLVYEMDKGIQNVSRRAEEAAEDAAEDREEETAKTLLRAEAQQIITDAARRRAGNN